MASSSELVPQPMASGEEKESRTRRGGARGPPGRQGPRAGQHRTLLLPPSLSAVLLGKGPATAPPASQHSAAAGRAAGAGGRKPTRAGNGRVKTAISLMHETSESDGGMTDLLYSWPVQK
jgi:hypothetical protein